VTEQATAFVEWLSTNGIVLAIAAITLFLIYRWARPAIHRLLVRVMRAQATTMGDDPAVLEDVDKRVTTVEDLLAKVLRASVFLALLVVILGLFDLWPILAGFGLAIAAITLAGQDSVLDYLMGILILLEGQYFKGDVIRVGTVEGTVEEVGLRRTVVRDARGVVHSMSNGLVRESANLTRTYAVAAIEIDGIADGDVEAAILVLETVAAGIADDPAFGDRLLERPAVAGPTRLTSAGASLLLRARVKPEARIETETEMRRRAAAGLAAASIEPIRPAAAARPR
jgi:small conductance mechanosensitive channel